MSSRETCPLSHLEERGHGFESDLSDPAGSKGASSLKQPSFLGVSSLTSLFVSSGSNDLRFFPPRKLVSLSKYGRLLLREKSQSCHRWGSAGLGLGPLSV